MDKKTNIGVNLMVIDAKMPNNKFGECIDCVNFDMINPNPKECGCKVKKGYVTKNVLIRAYCKDFEELTEKVELKERLTFINIFLKEKC